MRNDRAKLETVLHVLDEITGLAPPCRFHVLDCALQWQSRWDKDNGRAKIKASLARFLPEHGKPLGAAVMVAEEGFEPPTQGL